MGPRARVHKEGDAPASTATKPNSESRKLRNRLSQQAFRARQALRLKELEEQLGSEPISDAVRTSQLSEKNAVLRDQLLSCHKKILSLQISMQSLAENTALALGLESLADSQSKERCSRCRRSEDGEERLQSSDEGYSSHTSGCGLEPLEEEPGDQPDTDYGITQWADLDSVMDLSTNVVHQPLIAEKLAVEIAAPTIESMSVGHNQQQQRPSSANLDFFSLSEHAPAFPADQAVQPNQQGSNFISTLPFPPSIPSKNMMGFEQYADLVSRSPPIKNCLQLQIKKSNSNFSDHMIAVEYFLQQKWMKRDPHCFMDSQFTESIKFMLSAFVCISWQSMTAWHAYTKAHVPLKGLTAWHVTKTPEAWNRIIPSYRPTKLQMSVQHPAIIDWVPWASLRDKLIIYHSANPCLDDLICDIGNSYVVPCDLSTLVAGFPVMLGYISVWDLVRAIAPDSTSSASPCSENGPARSTASTTDCFTNPDNTNAYDTESLQGIIDEADNDDQMYSTPTNLPAPNVAALFESRALAIQSFKLLDMDRGASTFSLDPEFFGRHPELFDPHSTIMVSGVPLRPSSRVSVPMARELNSSVLGQYKDLSRWAFNHSLDE